MKEKISGIYCFENILNNEKYTGQAEDISTRIKQHILLLRRGNDDCVVLQRAWNKYGEENFIAYEVERCSLEELADREIYWIKELHSHVTENGYNVSWGGKAFFRGNHHTEDAKKRISENSATPIGPENYMFGRERTLEEKESISLGLLEYYKTHPGQGTGREQSEEERKSKSEKMTGKTYGEETKEKHRQYMKGRHLSEETKQKIADIRRGSKASEETKRKMSESHMGRPPTNLGGIASDETREKMSIAGVGRKRINNTSSIYVGVCFDKKKKKWMAYITKNKKRKHIGYFQTENEAALAYNEKAIELYGENARLNIIEEKEE